MAYNEELFHKMASEMRSMATGMDFNPSNEDVVLMLDALANVVGRYDRVLAFVAGEYDNDPYWMLGDRSTVAEEMFDQLVDAELIEELRGDDHVAYIRL